MENNQDKLQEMYEKALFIRDKIVTINEQNGTIERVQKMQKEILMIGWDGIQKKYHPDANLEEKAAPELFKMYKYIYENMKQKLLIH